MHCFNVGDAQRIIKLKLIIYHNMYFSTNTKQEYILKAKQSLLKIN